MEKILTAEDLALNFEIGNTKRISIEDAKEAMIEFAKLHVEAALKEASEKIKLTDEVCEVLICEALQNHWFKEYIDKDSILNSYPLENIK